MLDQRPPYAPQGRHRTRRPITFSSAPLAPTDAGGLPADLDVEVGQWGVSGWTRAEVCAYRKALRKTHTTAPDAAFPVVAEPSPDGYASAAHAIEVAIATLRRSAPGDAALLRELSLGALYRVDTGEPGARDHGRRSAPADQR